MIRLTSSNTFSRYRQDPGKEVVTFKIVTHYTWGGMRGKPKKVCVEGVADDMSANSVFCYYLA